MIWLRGSELPVSALVDIGLVINVPMAKDQ